MGLCALLQRRRAPRPIDGCRPPWLLRQLAPAAIPAVVHVQWSTRHPAACFEGVHVATSQREVHTSRPDWFERPDHGPGWACHSGHRMASHGQLMERGVAILHSDPRAAHRCVRRSASLLRAQN